MIRWYANLSRRERNAFWACYGGWALDAMDIQLYTFLIPTLSTLWTMSRGEAGIIASSALMTSAVGGWLTGVLADRYGRVTMLQITILWYSVFTAASGLTNSFTELLVVRSLQGFGFGGEWTVGAVLIGEIVAAEHRGKAVGSVQSGWATGWAIAALLSTFTLAYLPEEWGWRFLFFVGAAPALMLFFVRRYVTEPDIFLDSSASRSRANFLSDARRIFSPPLLRTTVLCSLLSTGVLSGMGPFMTELFPTSVRASGQGFAYNFGRAIGAFFPALVGLLSTSMTLGFAISIFAGSAYGLLVVAAYCLPETKGKVLNIRETELPERREMSSKWKISGGPHAQ